MGRGTPGQRDSVQVRDITGRCAYDCTVDVQNAARMITSPVFAPPQPGCSGFVFGLTAPGFMEVGLILS